VRLGECTKIKTNIYLKPNLLVLEGNEF